MTPDEKLKIEIDRVEFAAHSASSCDFTNDEAILLRELKLLRDIQRLRAAAIWAKDRITTGSMQWEALDKALKQSDQTIEEGL